MSVISQHIQSFNICLLNIHYIWGLFETSRLRMQINYSLALEEVNYLKCKVREVLEAPCIICAGEQKKIRSWILPGPLGKASFRFSL